jgi:hypothetical protein
MDAPTPNMLVSSSSIGSPSTKPTTYAWIERFNLSKFVIRNGITSFISYSNTRQIAFPHPT